MIRRIGRGALAALLAAAAASSGMNVQVATPAPGSTVAPAPNDNKSQAPAPAPTPAQRPVYLGGGFTGLTSINPHGCPWPGRRAACARRRAGRTRRMR